MKIIDVAKLFVGKPYLWGGNYAPQGLDCSGLVCEVLRSLGHIRKDDYSAQMLYTKFHNVERDYTRKPIAPGFLLFFGRSESEIIHIAIYLGDGLMIEAGGGGRTTTTYSEAIKKNAYVRIRPLSTRTDLVGILKIE